jgi:hypothetical protein
MRGAARLYTVLLVVILFSFGYGLSRLFVLRFERGDIYPAYSSLRSDPLGSKALYRSLEAIPGFQVERGFSALAKRKNLKGTTILVLGEQEDLFSRTGKKELEALQRLVVAGNRLVVGFLPRTSAYPSETEKEKREARQKSLGDKAKPPGKDSEKGESLAEKWGVTPEIFPDTGKGISQREAPAVGDPLALPGQLPRHSRLFFKLAGSDWQTIYRSGGQPVIIERALGKGSIVLLADSYPFSNEALRGEPDASLLAWIIGASRGALFDEFHLGVGESPGMGNLLRSYHLENFFAALFLLALIYIWKSSVPFVRVLPPPESGVPTSGKDNFTGLVNLLRRNIAGDKLLEACFREWRRSFSRDFRKHPEKLFQVEALIEKEASLPPRQRDLEASYRGISELLAKKKRL